MRIGTHSASYLNLKIIKSIIKRKFTLDKGVLPPAVTLILAVTLISVTTQVKALEVAINTIIPDITNKSKTFNIDSASKIILESLVIKSEQDLYSENQHFSEKSEKLPIFNLHEFIKSQNSVEELNLNDLGLNYLVDNPILNLNSLNIKEIIELFDKLSDPKSPTPLNLRNSTGEFIDFSNVDLEAFYSYLTTLKNPRAMGTNSPGIGAISTISVKEIKPNIENYLESFSLASNNHNSWSSNIQDDDIPYNSDGLSYIENNGYEQYNYGIPTYTANNRNNRGSVIGIGIPQFNDFNNVYATNFSGSSNSVDTIDRKQNFEINININFSTTSSTIPSASAQFNNSSAQNITSSSANSAVSVDISFQTTTTNIANNSNSWNITNSGITLSGSNPGSPDADFDVASTGMFIGRVVFFGFTHPFSLETFDIDITVPSGKRSGTIDSFGIALNQATTGTSVHFENHTTGGSTDTVVIAGGSIGTFNFGLPLPFTTGDDIEFFASGPNQLRAVLLNEITINVPEPSTYAKIVGLFILISTVIKRRYAK